MNRAVRANSPVPIQPSSDKSVVLDLQRLIRHAIEDSGLAHKVVAIALNVAPEYLSKMLSGEKPFSLDRVEQLPSDVQHAFARRYAEAIGWHVQASDPRVEAMADLVHAATRALALMTTQRPTMAKATHGEG